MIRTTLAVTAAVMFAALQGVVAQSIPADRAADAAAIRAEIERISQAFVDKDPPTLAATHGTNWRGFTPWSGHVIRGRTGYMNEATFEPGTPKGQGMVGFRLSDFDVVFYGDTAVASFVMDLDVVNGGVKGTQKLTILDVFHKDAKKWIQVASNTSLHPDEINRMMSERRSDAGADALSGKWGSGGQVFLDLVFDGRSTVTGTAIWRDGQNVQSSPIKAGTFDSTTGAFKLEGNTSAPDGQPTTFVIEGRLERNAVKGTYTVGANHGSFEFTRM